MFIAHINYIRKLVGVDYIGIGSDFNGIPEWVNTNARFFQVYNIYKGVLQ